MPNRAFLEKEIQGRLDERRRYGLPTGLLFVDIDRFKTVNDRFGHAAGDDLMRIVADTLSRASRSFDVVGRWGGEEFVGILRNVGPESLAQIAERYRMLIEHSYSTQNADPIRVTVSIGATLARTADTVSSLVERADRLMYASKSAGRNRVTAEGPSGQVSAA